MKVPSSLHQVSQGSYSELWEIFELQELNLPSNYDPFQLAAVGMQIAYKEIPSSNIGNIDSVLSFSLSLEW